MKKLIGMGILALGVAFSGSALAADGAATFKAKCAACHGADGQGTAMAPAFQGNDFIKTSKDADISAVITAGRDGAAKKYKNFAIGMPKQSLAGDDLSAVIAHLKSLAAKK